MAIKKRPVSPRQKMINLMYIVLLAMLALNVSTEVLQGFAVVQESLDRTTNNASKENAAIYNDFRDQMLRNPEKARVWYEKATEVRNMSDSLYNFAETLKLAIVKEADGADGNLKNIQNTDNIDAAGTVMLAPLTGKGKSCSMPSTLIVSASLALLPIRVNMPLSRATCPPMCQKAKLSWQELAGIHVRGYARGGCRHVAVEVAKRRALCRG